MLIKLYLIYIPLAIITTIALILLMRDKSNKARYKILIILAFLAMTSHLIKPFFFPYTSYEYPNILRKITFENICAVSALIYPLVLIIKNKVLLDYISTIGLIGGFLAFLYPTEVILGQFDSMNVTFTHQLFSFDTIRFFFVHYLLFVIPFLMLYFKLHSFNLKRIWIFPFTILSILVLIFINEYILETLGMLSDVHSYAGYNTFYDHNIRNSSFVFGIPDSYDNISWIITMLVPNFLMKPNYVPIFWITIPTFIYGPLIYYGFYKLTSKNHLQAI